LNNALSFNEYVEADGNPPTCEQEAEELCKEVTDNKEKAEAVTNPHQHLPTVCEKMLSQQF
jgi:hypothetical protein